MHNEIRYIAVDIKREGIGETLLGIGTTLNEFLMPPLPEPPTIDDLLATFDEHQGTLSSFFSMQTKIKPETKNGLLYGGRIKISLNPVDEDTSARLKVEVLDNCEFVSERLLDEMYFTVCQYFLDRGFKYSEIDKGFIHEK